MPVTPRCESASTTALITAGAEPIVPASPTPFTPSRFVGEGVTVLSRSKFGNSAAEGIEIVGEARGEQVPGVVVHGFLPERLRDALGDAAVNLALDDERVDLVPAVVHRRVRHQADAARLLVDLDHRDVRAEREREVRWVPGDRGLEQRLGSIGQVVGREGLERDGRERHRPVGRAPHNEAPALVDEVGLVHFELMGCDPAGLVDDPVRCERDGCSSDGEGPRAVCVHAEGRYRRVGVEHLDVFGRNAEPVGDDHRPRCLVTLTVWRRARHHLHLRGRHHAHRGRFPAAGRIAERGEHPARRQAAHLDVRRDPDAEMAG